MKQNIRISLHIVIITLCNLVFLFFLKYSQHNLQLRDLDFSNLGNVINLLFGVLNIALILINAVFNKLLKPSFFKTILIFSYIVTFNLIVVFIIQRVELSIFDYYFFSYPLVKVLLTVNYFSSAFIQLNIIIISYLIFFNDSLLNIPKALIYSIVVVMGFLLLTIAYNLFAFNYINGKNGSENRVAVVLGAAVYRNNLPSPILKGRIEKAEELIRSGKVEKIQLTGGQAPGEITEGRCAFNYLVDRGVNKNKLILEEKTKTTSEQIRFIKHSLIKTTNFKNVIVISDEFHLVRVLEMSRFFNLDVHCIESDYKLNWEKELFYRIRDSIGLLLFWFFAI